MIFTDRTVIVQKGTSSINDTIVLYRGDKDIEIRFTLNEGSPFRFGSGASPNIIEKTEAAYGQLVIKTPNDLPSIFSEVAPTNEGKIVFTITAEMIDEITEVGNYTFQIRLLDESRNSRATLPEVVNGIEIREPIATEDVSTTNEVGVATVGYALTTAGTTEDAFDSQGNYNKTTWGTGDRITAQKLNKIEAGIDGINKKVASEGTGEQGPQGQGLTTEVKNALLDCFNHVAWIDANGQTYYNNLEAALFGGSTGGNTVSVTGIELSSNEGSAYRGHSTTVSATILPTNATNKAITWSSSDESVATITANGSEATINCLKEGSSIITATTVDGGYIDTFGLTVTIAVPTAITLSSSTGNLAVGETVTITATIAPQESEDKSISWTVEDGTKASIQVSSDTSTCTITALDVGSTIVTATTNTASKTATYAVNILSQALEEISPQAIIKSSQGNSYYYYGETKDAINTNDPSTKQLLIAGKNSIYYDLTGVSQVKITRVVNKVTYGSTPCNVWMASEKAELNDGYNSDASLVSTNKKAYSVITSAPSVGYMKPVPVVGDEIDWITLDVDPNMPYLITNGSTTANPPTSVNDFISGYGGLNLESAVGIKVYKVGD